MDKLILAKLTLVKPTIDKLILVKPMLAKLIITKLTKLINWEVKLN
jgi:hypothetical protein